MTALLEGNPLNYRLEVDLDRGDYGAIMLALKQVDQHGLIEKEAASLRRLVARMARDAIWPLAPVRAATTAKGTLRRSAASIEYGPLKQRNKWPVTGSLKKWGVRGPYYMHFVRAGTAGPNRVRVGPRNFVKEGLDASQDARDRTFKEGVESILQRHFSDTGARAIRRGLR